MAPKKPSNDAPLIERLLPFLKWFQGYNTGKFKADSIGGITVALVLIPQSMAYAQLAGLPAYYGLYAAFLPPMVASLFGSSNQLATGPVAVVSLMTAIALEPLATTGSEAFIAYAVLLAFCVGLFQFLLGVLKLGLIVNFLSHPVVNGFTNAAAIIIATSQLSKFFGVSVDKAEHHYETIYNVIVAAVDYTHIPTFLLAALSIGIMAGLKKFNPKIPNVLVAVVVTTVISWSVGFDRSHVGNSKDIESDVVVSSISQFNNAVIIAEELAQRRVDLGPTIKEAEQTFGKDSVAAAKMRNQLHILNLRIDKLKIKVFAHRAALRKMKFDGAADGDKIVFHLKGETPENANVSDHVWRMKVGNKPMNLDQIKFTSGGAVVGTIPEGLPKLALPKFDIGAIVNLIPMVIIITLLGFMEAISIAKAMAAKTGQRLNPNQELIGQGLSNMVGSIGQSYPCSGSFSRSAVNLSAGAMTGLSNVISSAVVVIALLFFTPLLYHLPQSVLASIIMMAVIGLVNVKGFIHAFQAQKHDGIVAVITFACTLIFAPHLDRGIFIGIALSLALYLFRTMKPDISVLSKYADGSYRSSEHWGLGQCKFVSVIRFNGSLFFTNVSYLEEQVLDRVANMPHLKHVLIAGNGINEIDASGEEMLATIVDRLREGGYDISFSGLNESVIQVLKRTHLFEKIGAPNFHRYVANAIDTIYELTHIDEDEDPCPLLTPSFRGLKVCKAVQKKLFTGIY